MDGRMAEWAERTCIVCPAQQLGAGEFDVVDQPGRDFSYDPAIGWRVDPHGVAVCVHPYRVGLPPGAYASADQPLPEDRREPVAVPAGALELPEDVTDLEGWLVAVLRTAPPGRLIAAVGEAERVAATRFPAPDVVAALRRVLSVELADGR